VPSATSKSIRSRRPSNKDGPPYFYEGETEHEPACPTCSEALLQVGKDGEMEVKEEYRGKIRFLEETTDHGRGGHLMIGLAIVEAGIKEH